MIVHMHEQKVVSVGHGWAVALLMPQRVGLPVWHRRSIYRWPQGQQDKVYTQSKEDLILGKLVIPELAKLDVILLLSAEQATMQM